MKKAIEPEVLMSQQDLHAHLVTISKILVRLKALLTIEEWAELQSFIHGPGNFEVLPNPMPPAEWEHEPGSLRVADPAKTEKIVGIAIENISVGDTVVRSG